MFPVGTDDFKTLEVGECSHPCHQLDESSLQKNEILQLKNFFLIFSISG